MAERYGSWQTAPPFRAETPIAHPPNCGFIVLAGIGSTRWASREATGDGGSPSRAPDRATLEALAPEVRKRLGFGGDRVEEPVPLERVVEGLAPPRIKPPDVARRDPHRRPRGTRPALDGEGVPRRRPRVPRQVRPDARHGRPPAHRGGRRPRPRPLRRAPPRRDPLRRRDERRRRRGAAGRPRLPRRRLGRPDRTQRADRARRGLAVGVVPRRHARPRPRGRPAPARPHAPPLPAVVRVLDARRLDRHPGRAATSRRCRRTSTTSSSRFARSPRPASGRAAACRAPAPGRAPIGCCSAPRARSA